MRLFARTPTGAVTSPPLPARIFLALLRAEEEREKGILRELKAKMAKKADGSLFLHPSTCFTLVFSDVFVIALLRLLSE